MIRQTIKNAILHSVVFCTTVLIFGIGYAAITNIWTNTSTLEVSSGSILSADSWNKLLGNFENLNSRLGSQSSHHARYYLNGNQVVNRTVWNRLNFTTKEYDYSNAVTTGSQWNYKAPEAGLYMVTAYVASNDNSWTAGNSYGVGVGINASSGPNHLLGYLFVSGSYTGRGDIWGTKVIKLNKDDLISFWFIPWNNNSTLTLGTPFNSVTNYVEITKIGN